jgi:hypothetical protein
MAIEQEILAELKEHTRILAEISQAAQKSAKSLASFESVVDRLPIRLRAIQNELHTIADGR